MSLNQIAHAVDAFRTDFPAATLDEMRLPEYIDKMEGSFCRALARIAGSAFGLSLCKAPEKFGICAHPECADRNHALATDGGCAWKASLGSDRVKAFTALRAGIVAIARFAQKGDFEGLDRLSSDQTGLADDVKWLIAYLYGEDRLLPLFSLRACTALAATFGAPQKTRATLGDWQRHLLAQKGEKSVLEFYAELNQVRATAQLARANRPRTSRKSSRPALLVSWRR